MSRRLRHLACTLMLAVPLGGCWVIDEIDKGQEVLDRHSGKKAEEKEEAKPATAPQNRTLDAYFTEQERQGKTKTFTPGQVSEGIVSCKLGGSVQFMTRESCAARGGHAS
jgi:hypothetical protein